MVRLSRTCRMNIARKSLWMGRQALVRISISRNQSCEFHRIKWTFVYSLLVTDTKLHTVWLKIKPYTKVSQNRTEGREKKPQGAQRDQTNQTNDTVQHLNRFKVLSFQTQEQSRKNIKNLSKPETTDCIQPKPIHWDTSIYMPKMCSFHLKLKCLKNITLDTKAKP